MNLTKRLFTAVKYYQVIILKDVGLPENIWKNEYIRDGDM